MGGASEFQPGSVCVPHAVSDRTEREVVSVNCRRGGRFARSMSVRPQSQQVRIFVADYFCNQTCKCSESEGFSIAPQFRSMIVKNLIAATSYQVSL